LNDDDALNLWRAFNVSGSRETLLPMFRKFENHPLLMQSLASEVANYRRAPANFERWIKDHPNFNPFNLSLVNARAHVLEFALRGLDDDSRKVLETIAAFRMPASYDTLAALFVGEGKLFPSELGLDLALKELEDRGLVGWDKRANRYDLHPIVRGVVWSGLPDGTRNGVFTSLHTYFDSVPKINEEKVDSLDDLTPAIELYNTLIGLRRYDDAISVYYQRIGSTLNRLGISRQRIELLEMLFPNGLSVPLQLTDPYDKIYIFNSLAAAYSSSGYTIRATSLLQLVNSIREEENATIGLAAGLRNLSKIFQVLGSLRESERAARRALVITRTLRDRVGEAGSLSLIGLNLATQGSHLSCEQALQRSKKIFETESQKRLEGIVCSYFAQYLIWQEHFVDAVDLADYAWRLANNNRNQRDVVHATRLQGISMLGIKDFARTDERLHHALTRARAVNLIEEEIQSLVALAELRRRQKDLKAARELLDDVWEYAERGPYPLFHADAFNVLAQIERDAGNNAAAVEAATKAYRLAWCDGEPYAYHWGLVAARKHLRELGAPEPQMPPFDESKYEPMPEVEINPKDEFYVEVEDIAKDEGGRMKDE
jgi:tetratricopeptide (TPR) repeat protein